MVKYKNLSLTSRGLKYKLNIAFYLMSVLPLLVCIYLVSHYILPQMGFKLDITVSILISIFIALAGFYVIKEVFDRIASVSAEAKLIVAGDISRKVNIGYRDEIGDLGEALNQLTQRIRSNMEELKVYSEKSTEINLEIKKHILILSNLLQISSLISHGDKLENILKFTVEKSRALANSDVAYLFSKDENTDTFSVKIKDGINSEHLLQLQLNRDDKVFNKLIQANQPLILDKENALTEDIKTAFHENFKLKGTLAVPVNLKGRLVGILGIGNKSETILYRKADRELLELFAKQIAIALENDILMQRVEKLEIKDALTGLYNKTFIHNRLQEEINRAIIYRRPCAFILLNIDNFQQFHENFGLLQAEVTLKKIAFLIRDSFTEIDRVARVGDNEFAVVLPEKNKRQAQELAENIRKKIDSAFDKERDVFRRLTVSGGVSENPLDGVNAEELITQAKEALNSAKTQGKNRIGILSQKL
jgi:diguanylate cyclase (GGDEF)-like protein